MKYAFFIAFVALCFTFLISCSKNDDPVPVPAATFNVLQPTLNQTYQAGDTVHINGTITCEANLHGYHVMVLNSNNDTLYNKEDHAHAMELTIDEMWVNHLTEEQDLKVIISCTINHEGAESIKEIPIRILD